MFEEGRKESVEVMVFNNADSFAAHGSGVSEEPLPATARVEA